LRRLWRRHLGYTRREIQVHALCKRLTAQGLAAMPRRISEIYGQISPLRDTMTVPVGFKGRRVLIPFVGAKMRWQQNKTPSLKLAWFDMVTED
jgi:hypothetical protein